MAIENYINDYTLSVNSNINNSSTSLTVSAAASIASGFRILVGTELMLVTAGGTTTSWTVTRGIESTAAASHNSGDTIHVVLTSTALDNVRTQISGIGTYANLPSSGMKSGDQWRSTDGPYNFVYDGSNWQAFYQGVLVTIPPSSSWSWLNQGTSSVASYGGALALSYQSIGNTDTMRGYYRSKPGSTYTVIANFTNFNLGAGIMLYDSGSSKVKTYHTYLGGNVSGYNWTNSTTFSSRIFSDIGVATIAKIVPPNMWLKVQDDGTHEIFSISYDNVNWFQISSINSATFLTPDNIGITPGDLANTDNSLGVTQVVPHFTLTYP